MDKREIERLKWRSRRGLLELDLVFTEFWAKNESLLSDEDIRVLNRLLQLPDHDILDLVMARQQISEDVGILKMVQRLKQG
jgi:antitoxin CptB